MIEALNSDQPLLQAFVQERLRVFHVEAVLFRDEGEVHDIDAIVLRQSCA